MRYLIDSNVLIDLTAKSFVDSDVVDILNDLENIIYVSDLSIMELIQWLQSDSVVANKKIKVLDVFKFIEEELGFQVKYVAKEHLKTMATLNRKTNDPIDRLIISIAITEKIPLISSDRQFPIYVSDGLKLIKNRK